MKEVFSFKIVHMSLELEVTFLTYTSGNVDKKVKLTLIYPIELALLGYEKKIKI